MNNNELAKTICKDILEYKTKNESFCEVYEKLTKKYNINTQKEKNKILVKVIHYITENKYDIISIKPLKFKKFDD